MPKNQNRKNYKQKHTSDKLDENLKVLQKTAKVAIDFYESHGSECGFSEKFRWEVIRPIRPSLDIANYIEEAFNGRFTTESELALNKHAQRKIEWSKCKFSEFNDNTLVRIYNKFCSIRDEIECIGSGCFFRLRRK